MKTAIDNAGRVVIPKAVRDAAGIEPGQELQIEYRDGAIVVEPAPRKVRLVRKGSLLVAVTQEKEPQITNEQVTRVIRELRNERSAR